MASTRRAFRLKGLGGFALMLGLLLPGAAAAADRDRYGDFNNRGDLEDLLYRLIEEFRTELADLGMKGPVDLGPPSSFLSGRPLDTVQLQAGYANNRYSVKRQ